MRTISTAGWPRLRKWVLLAVSLIAAVIWIRNLTILLPSGETEVAIAEIDDPSPVPNEPLSDISGEAFQESEEWRDPFVAPTLRPSNTGKANNQKTRKARQDKSIQPTPPPWKLTGVVWNKSVPAAVLTSLDGLSRFVVIKGDTVGEYMVTRVNKSSVQLRCARRSWNLTLDEKTDVSNL